jgi:t-SNARE complex subunit (syntaxin)
MTDEEIERKMDEAIMEGGDLLADSSQMFAAQIIDDRYKREEAKIALMYAKEQRKELEQIERSIAQLHQMSVDLAALVQGQGDILDQMEVSIGSAVADSIKGLKMLEVAEGHKISSRKKKIIIGIIVGVVIGVTVLTIVGVTAGVIALCS